MHGGFSRMDRSIQRRLEQAEASGDPDWIAREHKFAQESYGMGTGAIVGGVVGTLLFMVVDTLVFEVIGGFLGHKIAED